MTVIAVTLLVLAVGVELGFGQLLPGLNELDVHKMNNCYPKGKNGKPIQAWMGPCFDTPSCKIPACCGIISGEESLFRIKYRANQNFTDGIFNGNLGGIALGNAVRGCEKGLLEIKLPLFQIIVPPTIAGYKRTLCDCKKTGQKGQTKCPQRAGQIYTLDIPFRFITRVITTFGLVKADFVAEVKTDSGETALCWGLYATLVSPQLVEYLLNIPKDILADPVKFLSNPFAVLEDPLVGLIGNNKPRQYFVPPGEEQPDEKIFLINSM